VAQIRFTVWAGALHGGRSGEWWARRRRELGLGFEGCSVVGGINRLSSG
jgi:hypothetical protein